MALTHTIEAAKREKEITSALFMDVRGAFDNVAPDRTMHVSLRQPLALLSNGQQPMP